MSDRSVPRCHRCTKPMTWGGTVWMCTWSCEHQRRPERIHIDLAAGPDRSVVAVYENGKLSHFADPGLVEALDSLG